MLWFLRSLNIFANDLLQNLTLQTLIKCRLPILHEYNNINLSKARSFNFENVTIYFVFIKCIFFFFI